MDSWNKWFDNNKIPLLRFFPLLLLAVGLYLVPVTIFETDFSMVPGDYGDARFNNYVLEHCYKYFTFQDRKFWDAPMMYPQANVIAFSDNLIGTAPIYTLFRIFGTDRETAFQLWLLTIFALNFIACYWVLSKWIQHTILASTGAYIFAFSILILGHLTNIQVFPRFAVPLVFFWSWNYLRSKQLKYLLGAFLGIVYQFYCGMYLGFFLIYSIIFLSIAYLIIYKDWNLFIQFKNFRILIKHIGILLLAVILLLPLAGPYMEASRLLSPLAFEDALSSIPTLRSYFFTSKASIAWPFLSEHAMPIIPFWWCHILFLGGLPWLGFLIALIALFKMNKSPEKKFIAFLLLALFLNFIFCLNINGLSLYRLVFEIPGFNSMRAINRITNVEVMFFVLIFAFIFKELLVVRTWTKWIVYFLPLLAIVDNLIEPQEIPRYNKKNSQIEIEAVTQKIKNVYTEDYAAIAYMPPKVENEMAMHINTMLAAQSLNIPCVNAYSGHYPHEYIDFFGKYNDTALTRWCVANNLDEKLILKIK